MNRFRGGPCLVLLLDGLADRGGPVHSPWGRVKLARIRDAGYEAVDLAAGRIKQVSGSEVRRRLDAGQDWEDLVPPAVAHLVQRAVTTGSDRMRLRRAPSTGGRSW